MLVVITQSSLIFEGISTIYLLVHFKATGEPEA